MNMTRWLLVSILLAMMSTAAFAQGSYTVEEMVEVRDFETVRFVQSSVRESGGGRMFNVLIRYADPDEVPAGGVASRKVSYRTRCENGEMAISVIIMRNVNAHPVVRNFSVLIRPRVKAIGCTACAVESQWSSPGLMGRVRGGQVRIVPLPDSRRSGVPPDRRRTTQGSLGQSVD